MKILFVIPYTPNKIRIRPYNLLRFLAARGNQVSLLTLWSNDMDRESIRQIEAEGIEVISFPLQTWRSLANCAYGALTGDPLQSFYCWQPKLAQTLVEMASGQGHGASFDAVHVEHLRGVRFGQSLLKNRDRQKGPPVIWDSVDCISYLFEQAAQSSKKLSSRLITRFELPRTRAYEARMAQQFDRTLVTSRLDHEAFAKLLPTGAEPVTVLPNGVDLDYFCPIPTGEREPETLVISGKMSYHANVSMVTHLMESVMPLIWSKKPSVKLWIVGKDPPPSIRALSDHPGVTVTGYIPDLRPYLQRAAVALAPLTYGAGIQNKVLEAMACGVPVVASPRAVAALSVQSGQEIIVESDPSAFAAQVVDLIDRPDRAGQIGSAGRHYVETNHDWLSIAGRLEEIYRQAGESLHS